MTTLGACPALPAFGQGPELFPGEAAWDPAFVPPPAAEAPPDSPIVTVALNASRFRPGEELALGLNVQNPLPGAAAELFVGVLAPDGVSLVIITGAGGIAAASLENLGGIAPTLTAPAGFALSNPGFLEFTFPPTGVPAGTYVVFGALLKSGALTNNQLDPGEVLAIDARSFTFSTAPPAGAVPFLNRPFAGEFRSSNFFDHFLPQEFIGATGLIVPYWGEQLELTVARDLNHQGYDFPMPEGTPLVASAFGAVVFAGPENPFFCPTLNQTVAGAHVTIEHVAPNGVRYRSLYGHMSRIDVQVGQSVAMGQTIGLSGNVGCSTGPHLHYEIFRTDPVTGRRITTDPYGWEGAQPDPWEAHPEGVKSVWLWVDGGAPRVFREARSVPNPSGSTARVTLTAFRWMGVDDTTNPGNEFVEVTLDPRFVTGPTLDLSGFTLRNKRGDVFHFPPGFQMQVGRPVLVYTGPGVKTDTELFWGLPAGAWDNAIECARLIYPTGGSYSFSNTAGACN